MAQPQPIAPPPEGSPSWRVIVDMPVFEKGSKRGRPTGWLSQNKPAKTTWQGIEHTEIRRLWRQAAFQAYQRARLPRGIGPIYVVVELQFNTRGKRDQPNFWPTVKPVIDALTPNRVDVRKKKTKAGGYRLETIHHIGWGVVPDDDERWVVYGPPTPTLPPIDRESQVQGRVIINITAYPTAT